MIKKNSSLKERTVYIVDGSRTPFLKTGSKPNLLSASDLAVRACQPLLIRQPFKPEDLDEVIVGCVAPSANETNIARIIALRLGCGHKVMGWTVQRNCASGLQALDNACQDIRIGRHDLILAGGTEAMSRTPLLFSDEMVGWISNLKSQKTMFKRLKALIRFRPQWLVPVIALLKGLYDPVVALSMGQTAEILAYEYGVDRIMMDKYSVQSHLRAMAAYQAGHFSEVVPVFDFQERAYEQDDGIRTDSSVERLAKLKPVFDKPFGSVTAGNSSQISDGAAFLILASEDAVHRYNLSVQAIIKDTAWAALDPARMGLGPVYAIQKLLKQQDLTVNDIDYWEINEAFASQVLACVRAMEGKSIGLGKISDDKLNIDGGAIALGHPVGASGARLVLHLMHILKRQQAKRGIATLCIGGGQGGAMMIERCEGVSV